MELKVSAMAPRLAALFPAPRRRSTFKALWYFSFKADYEHLLYLASGFVIMEIHGCSCILPCLQGIDELFGDGLSKADIVTAAAPEPTVTSWVCNPHKAFGQESWQFVAAVTQPLLKLLSPVRWMRAIIISFDTFLQSLAKPRKHMRSMKAVVALSTTAYLRSPGTKYPTDKDSPQKYQGTKVHQLQLPPFSMTSGCLRTSSQPMWAKKKPRVALQDYPGFENRGLRTGKEHSVVVPHSSQWDVYGYEQQSPACPLCLPNTYSMQELTPMRRE
ncbi:hypothetical protein INR49_021707 [Caranx melampygus]|nr:hypothetical protein INR49_021707 [Caranx melampygus]